MNPNSGEQSRNPFPYEKPAEGLERQRERGMEQEQPAQESGQSQQPKAVTTQVQTMPLPLPLTTDQPAPTTPPAADSKTKDLPAQDADVIEKEWVHRAKSIVNQTQDDPYVQKKEINRAGADYLKKRFNKTIPTDDAAKA